MSKLVRVNTEMEVVNYDYQWNIQNFRFSCKSRVGKSINSPIFRIPNTKVKGYLKVYPGGVTDLYKDYVSVYLVLYNDEDANMVGKFSLWIPVADGSGKDSGLVNFSLEKTFGYADYIKRDYVLDSKNGILVGEKLTFMCDIHVTTGVMNNSNLPDLDDVSMSVESRLVNDFKKLFEERAHTDVTLKIGDQRFEAHKLILMARSTIFKTMFTEQSEKTEFVIDNVSVDLMNDLLQYLYTGKVNIAGSKMMDFWMVVCRYNLKNSELKDKLEKELSAQINHENVVELFEFGDDQGMDKLYDNCFDYIVKNFREIVHLESYKELMNSQPDLVSLILEHVSDNLINNSM